MTIPIPPADPSIRKEWTDFVFDQGLEPTLSGESLQGYDVVQQLCSNWTQHNFPTEEPVYPLLGMGEEIGETAAAYLRSLYTKQQSDPESPLVLEKSTQYILHMLAQMGIIVHSHLKMLQGIRGTPEEHRAKAEHACSCLLVIFSMYFGNKEFVEMAANGLQLTEIHLPESDTVEDGVGDLQLYLVDFCSRNGINAADAMLSTTLKVVKRDWVLYPETGKPPASSIPE